MVVKDPNGGYFENGKWSSYDPTTTDDNVWDRAFKLTGGDGISILNSETVNLSCDDKCKICCDKLPDSIVTRENESITEGELVTWDGNKAIVKYSSKPHSSDHVCNCKRYEPTINWKFIAVLFIAVVTTITIKLIVA